jgi:hypothetical protein
MFPLLFSFLSGVRELSATASLAEFQQPEAPSELPVMLGIPSRDLLTSLCPIAVALIVATTRYYNEKQMEQRASDPDDYSNPLSTFGDIGTASYNDCGNFGTALEHRRPEMFYISNDSMVVFRVCGSMLKFVTWALMF